MPLIEYLKTNETIFEKGFRADKSALKYNNGEIITLFRVDVENICMNMPKKDIQPIKETLKSMDEIL